MFAALVCFALSLMSLEEKVGQALMVHFHGEEVNDDARTLVEEMHVGGVIYYTWANGLTSLEQVRALSSGLQALSPSIPLLLAVDQEGGLVSRLNRGFTVFPGNKALGMIGDADLVEECAFAMGQELLAAQVNMNLAPVVDVNSNPRNPVIGIRSFGSDVEEVALFGARALQGYRRAGVIPCLKHFPGHGDVEIDPHADLPTVHRSREELGKRELVPFARLAREADAIMTAHIMLPSLDSSACATLSKPILGLLRHELGFQGVIVSDSLTMEGVLKTVGHSLEEAAIRAFDAGCDLLILGGRELLGTRIEITVADIRGVHQALVRAVREGRISEERLDESVQRILDLKTKYALPIQDAPAFQSHRELAAKVAALALQTREQASLPSPASVALFAPKLVRSAIEQTPLLHLGRANQSLFFDALEPTILEWIRAQELAEKSDLVIFCSYNAWRNPYQAELIHSLEKTKPLVLVVLRDPLDASLFPSACLTLTTFSPTAPSLQAACDEIKNRLNYNGD